MIDRISEYRSAAVQQMSDAGVLLSRRTLNALHEGIFAEGKRELHILQEMMPADAFERCRLFVEQEGREMNHQALHRLLGFGYRLTQSFASFRRHKSAHHQLLARLGAWSNLIISLYDFFIDSKLMRPIARQVILERIMHEGNVKRPLHSYVLPGYTPCYWLILDLIGIFGKTARSAMGRQSFTELLKHIDHAAEVQNTFHAAKKFDPHAWREKSTGPFLILCAIALADDADENSNKVEAYEWATHFGAFIGLIDDLTDYGIDSKSGDFNKVLESYMRADAMELFASDFASGLQCAFPEGSGTANEQRWLPALACLNSWVGSWDEYPADAHGYFQDLM